jgi:hypothetical protein
VSRRLVLVPLAGLCAVLLGALVGIGVDPGDRDDAASAPGRSRRIARPTGHSSGHVVSFGVTSTRSSTSRGRAPSRGTPHLAEEGPLGVEVSDAAGGDLFEALPSAEPALAVPPFEDGVLTAGDHAFRSGATLANIALPLCLAMGDCSAEGDTESGDVGRQGRSGPVAGNVPAPVCLTVAGDCRAEARAKSGDTGPDGRSGDTLGNVPVAACMTVSGRCSSSSSAQPGSSRTGGRTGTSLANAPTALCVTVTGQCRTEAGSHRSQGPHRDGLNVALALCLALPGHCQQ